MIRRKTKVVKIGAFWKIQVYFLDQWITLRDLYSTREKARQGAMLTAIN